MITPKTYLFSMARAMKHTPVLASKITFQKLRALALNFVCALISYGCVHMRQDHALSNGQSFFQY